MRPRLFAAEIPLKRCHRQADSQQASMRPRLFAAEIDTTVKNNILTQMLQWGRGYSPRKSERFRAEPLKHARFNEAAAIHPVRRCLTPADKHLGGFPR